MDEWHASFWKNLVLQYLLDNPVESLHGVRIPHQQCSHAHKPQLRVKSHDITGRRTNGAIIVSGEEVDQRDYWVTREPLREFL